jgi:hypothetical protein
LHHAANIDSTSSTACPFAARNGFIERLIGAIEEIL